MIRINNDNINDIHFRIEDKDIIFFNIKKELKIDDILPDVLDFVKYKYNNIHIILINGYYNNKLSIVDDVGIVYFRYIYNNKGELLELKESYMYYHEYGHLVYRMKSGDNYQAGEYYSDNHEIVDLNKLRPCKKCNKNPTKDGHDDCIANLPNVKYACCGHGYFRPYVSFNDGEYKQFENIEELKKYVDKKQ